MIILNFFLNRKVEVIWEVLRKNLGENIIRMKNKLYEIIK